MQVATKGKGGHLKYVSEDELKVIIDLNKRCKELEGKLSEATDRIKQLEAEINKTKLENVGIVKGLISR